MFFALDVFGNRVHASTSEIHSDLRCPLCGEPVRHRRGENRRWHFSHLPDSTCPLGKDKDYNHEWHIRMQEYFPLDCREYRFIDSDTGELHIADVFLPESNIILEFQHSPITEEEFYSRSNFHLKEHRRVVWLFDESETTPKPGHLGKFKESYMSSSITNAQGLNPYCWRFPQNPYADLYYKWLYNPRAFLANFPDFETVANELVICVYTGVEGECFHRLQYKTYDGNDMNVTFSLHNIAIDENLDCEEFFVPESHWQQQPDMMNRFLFFNQIIASMAARASMEEYKRAQAQRLNELAQKQKPVQRYSRRKRHF